MKTKYQVVLRYAWTDSMFNFEKGEDAIKFLETAIKHSVPEYNEDGTIRYKLDATITIIMDDEEK